MVRVLLAMAGGENADFLIKVEADQGVGPRTRASAPPLKLRALQEFARDTDKASKGHVARSEAKLSPSGCGVC
jgi:hypothetical protein